MSKAAKQCREWIEANYPGVRIGRKACRNTAGGYISQHSAYKSGAGSYDSNALDIFGPEALDYDEERAFVDEIVVALKAHRADWSIKSLLWNVTDHYGHAHVDFWPSCATRKWCGQDISPPWRYSDGTRKRAKDPSPENGPYAGPGDDEQETDIMPKQVFALMIRAAFDLDEEFQPAHGADYWIELIDDPDNPEWADFWSAWGKQVSRKDTQ